MIKNLLVFITLLLIILTGSVFFSKPVFAEILFQDNFDDGNADGWVVSRNMQWGNNSLQCYRDGQVANWTVDEGKYGIHISGPGCVTETMPVNWNSDWKNYIFEVNAIFVRGTDANIAFRYSGSPDFDWYGYHFGINQNPNNSKITIQRVLNTNIYSDNTIFPLQHGVTYHLKIVVDGENIKLFVNDSLALDYPDAGGRFPSGSIALQASVGGDPESQVWFDNVVVRSIDELEPPEPEVKTPIVLLPGLGASWDTSAMLTGGAGDDWKLTPFVNVYDNFRNTFVDNGGFIKGQDYFEYYYDWRQPLDTLADQFKTYLETVVLTGKPEETKVNLVGHSLGGLLAKSYAQKYGLDKVNKIVTAGSPHQGALIAWQVWAGAEQGDPFSWGWLALELYLQLQKGKYSSPVDAVHDLAPSVNNLMPTFDFAKRNGEVISVNSMSDFNSYLNDLTNNLSEGIKDILYTIAGNNYDTKRWVNLVDRSLSDQLLGKWVDGKPANYESVPEGDLTVLELSALVDGATGSATITSQHTGLLSNETGIQSVLNALNLDEIEPSTEIISPVRNPSLVFLLHSPANIKVTAPDGSQAGYKVAEPMTKIFYSEIDKLLIIYGAESGDYQAEVIGTDTGYYQLEVGQLTETENVWTTLSGQTSNGEKDQYSINFDADNPNEEPLTDSTGKTQVNMASLIFNQIKNQVEQLDFGKKLNKRKNPVMIYLAKINGLILEDLTQIQAGRYDNARLYTRSLMVGAYNLRQKIDAMAEKTNLDDSTRANLKNQADEAGRLLIDAYGEIFPQSGETLKLKGVTTHLNVSWERNRAASALLENFIDKPLVGDAYQLSLDMLNQAIQATSSSLPTAWAKSVVSRILALEATKLID